MGHLFRLFMVFFGTLFFNVNTASAEDILWFPLDTYTTPYCDFTCYYEHGGVDYAGNGMPIYAPMAGEVVDFEDTITGQLCDPDFGNYVKIRNGPYEVFLAHMQYGSVDTHGGYVNAGDLVGYSGNTGFTMTLNSEGEYQCNIGGGYHLHLELRLNGVSVDPENYWRDDTPVPADPVEDIPIVIEETVEVEYPFQMVRAKPDGDDFSVKSYYYNDYKGSMKKYDYTEVNDEGEEEVLPVITDTKKPSNTFGWYSAEVYSGNSYSELIQVTTTSSHTYVQVYLSDGEGDFDAGTEWKSTGTPADAVFFADYTQDGLDDLIVGYEQTDGNMLWKYCYSDGVDGFASCIQWGTTTFGKSSDTFVVGDFNGNGTIELLRGRESSSDCSGKLRWKYMATDSTVDFYEFASVNTTDDSTTECWGYDGETFLVGNVDGNTGDDLVKLDVSSEVVEAKVGTTSGVTAFSTSSWADDVGRADGVYHLFDIDEDGRDDLIHWNDSSGNLQWRESRVNSDGDDVFRGMADKLRNLTFATDRYIVFGIFSKFEDDAEPRSYSVYVDSDALDDWSTSIGADSYDYEFFVTSDVEDWPTSPSYYIGFSATVVEGVTFSHNRYNYNDLTVHADATTGDASVRLTLDSYTQNLGVEVGGNVQIVGYNVYDSIVAFTGTEEWLTSDLQLLQYDEPVAYVEINSTDSDIVLNAVYTLPDSDGDGYADGTLDPGEYDDQYLFMDVDQNGAHDPCIRRGTSFYCDTDINGYHDHVFSYGATSGEYYSNGTGVTVRYGNAYYSDTDADGSSNSSCTYGTGTNEKQRTVWRNTIMVRWDRTMYVDRDMNGATDESQAFGWDYSTQHYYLADMNGDGAVDFVIREGNEFMVDDDVNHDGNEDWKFNFGDDSVDAEYFFADIDGDGKDDVIRRKDPGTGTANRLRVLYNSSISRTCDTCSYSSDTYFDYGHGLSTD